LFSDSGGAATEKAICQPFRRGKTFEQLLTIGPPTSEITHTLRHSFIFSSGSFLTHSDTSSFPNQPVGLTTQRLIVDGTPDVSPDELEASAVSVFPVREAFLCSSWEATPRE
jgi:hypothetical protein